MVTREERTLSKLPLRTRTSSKDSKRNKLRTVLKDGKENLHNNARLETLYVRIHTSLEMGLCSTKRESVKGL